MQTIQNRSHVYTPEKLQNTEKRLNRKKLIMESLFNRNKQKLICIKTSIHTTSCYQLIKLCDLRTRISGILYYKKFNDDTFYYTRISHDPLNYEDLTDCLYFFIPSLMKTIQELHKIDVIHRVSECLTYVLMINIHQCL